MPYNEGMRAAEFIRDQRELRPGQWVDDYTIARLLGIHHQTLKNWRWFDAREGRKPGQYRGGLIYRKFNGSVRYLVTPELLGRLEARDAR